MDIKPIETVYKGYRFRSRLEARWAVFFDELGIKWEYEPQGYKLSTGECYLPDFYLPLSDLWVEIKGKEPNAQYINMLEKFSEETRKSVLLAIGLPSENEKLFCNAIDDGGGACFWFNVNIYSNPFSLDSILFFRGRDRPRTLMPTGVWDGHFYSFSIDINNNYHGDVPRAETLSKMIANHAEAIKKAKQARFEHKNKGEIYGAF